MPKKGFPMAVGSDSGRRLRFKVEDGSIGKNDIRYLKNNLAMYIPPTAAPIPVTFCRRMFSKNFPYWASVRNLALSSAKVLKVVNAPRNPRNSTGKYSSNWENLLLHRTKQNPAANAPAIFTASVPQGKSGNTAFTVLTMKYRLNVPSLRPGRLGERSSFFQPRH